MQAISQFEWKLAEQRHLLAAGGRSYSVGGAPTALIKVIPAHSTTAEQRSAKHRARTERAFNSG